MELKKKSFILHVDSLDILSDLSDEQAGKLLKAMLAFHKGEDMDLDPLTKMAFSFFKNQFLRDNEKYLKTCEARAQAGSKGGKQKKQNLANASKSKQKVAKVADSDNESDSDSDSDTKDLIVPSETKRSKFKYSDDDMRFAKEMFIRVQIVTPNAKEPKYENWANTIRLMRESDKRTHQDMWRVFDWANKDSFWCSNILSPDKLRKQFDKLEVKANETNQPRHNAPSNDGLSDSKRAILEARARRDATQQNSGFTMGENGRALLD